MPYSGKSYYTSLCKEIFKKKKIFNTKSLFYHHLLQKKKINFICLIFIKFKSTIFRKKDKLFHRNTNNKKKINLKKSIRRIFFLRSFIIINMEKYRLFALSKKKYQAFYDICKSLINMELSTSRKKQLNRWLVDELNAFYLAKIMKSDGMLIISEGFIQRIHSYFLEKNELEMNIIKRYFYYLPQSNYTFYVEGDIEIIKTRLEQKLDHEKERFYYHNIEFLNDKMLKIYDEASNKDNIYSIKDKNSFEHAMNNIMLEK